MNADAISKLLQTYVIPGAIGLLKAVAVWYIGRWGINVGVNILRKTLTHNKLDATLVRYLCSIVGGLLTVFLALGVMSVVGIETTSFAAVAAGAGLAIGAAWSGMLANFAAGVFIIVMRPFKVGDHIEAGGVCGVIREIGLFATQIDTDENVHTLIGNGQLFGDRIQNYSANPTHICSMEFGVPSGGGFRERMDPLCQTLQSIPDVTPGSVEVRFKGFSFGSPTLEARVACPHEHFERVRADVADAIDRAFGDLGPVPMPYPMHPPGQTSAYTQGMEPKH